MKDGYWYFFVEPLLSEYRDDSTTVPLATCTVQFEDTEYDVAFIGESHTLHLLRIRVPDVSPDMAKERSEMVSRRLQLLKEHALSILRVLYDPDVSLYPMSTWNYVDSGAPPSFALRLQENINSDWQFPGEKIVSAFGVTLNCRNEVKLLTDSLDRRVPLQYRYLSLYKLLEMTFFRDGKPTKEFDEFLAPYQAEFASRFPPGKSLKAYIIGLRARCAHITANKGAMGVTMLSNKDATEVEAFLPFVARIASEIINQHSENAGLSIMLDSPSPKK
jgi:hypothetical protein